MAVFKEMQFPVSVRWRGGRLATTKSTGKEPIEVAAPPEFRDGLAGYWSPEDLLVASVASCFTLTLAAVAEKGEAPLLDATVTATGHLSHRDDGRFGFVSIEVDATLETIPGGEQMVRRAARIAEERCLVSQALDVPVQCRAQGERGRFSRVTSLLVVAAALVTAIATGLGAAPFAFRRGRTVTWLGPANGSPPASCSPPVPPF